MTRPRLLDLFCGAGGAAVGYYRAGFDIVGVDNRPQPNYPFEFHKADALIIAADISYVHQFDAIHASPPCQRWTRAQRQRKNHNAHQDLITPLRPLLEAAGLPYVIENVEYCDALKNTILLCGSMFDLDIQNHRLFESNWPLEPPTWPCRHRIWAPRRYPGTPRHDGTRPGAMVVNRMASGVTHQMLSEAMVIDWIPANGRTRPTNSLSEAIPPAYTELIGTQLLAHIRVKAAA